MKTLRFIFFTVLMSPLSAYAATNNAASIGDILEKALGAGIAAGLLYAAVTASKYKSIKAFWKDNYRMAYWGGAVILLVIVLDILL